MPATRSRRGARNWRSAVGVVLGVALLAALLILLLGRPGIVLSVFLVPGILTVALPFTAGRRTFGP